MADVELIFSAVLPIKPPLFHAFDPMNSGRSSDFMCIYLRLDYSFRL
ncbi:MAG: hypothetical protein ACJAWS_000641 [Oleiphilaceae bacterium]|jgi:hypothetical protein